MIISEVEFLRRAHLNRETLEIFIREEWLIPSESDSQRAFTEMDLARAELIRDLQQNMGVNEPGLSVILHLIDQMHGMRRAMAELMQRMKESG